MRTIIRITTILLILLVLSFSQFSCRTMEKTALPCPEVSMKKNTKFLSHQKGYKKKAPGAQKENTKFLALKHSKDRKEKEIKNKPIVPVASTSIDRVPALIKLSILKVY